VQWARKIEFFVMRCAVRQFASLINGMLECWSIGVMGLKDLLTIRTVSFSFYPQCSISPTFHCSMWLA
jgi:hypothetical protein